MTSSNTGPQPNTDAALDFLERWQPGGRWVLTAIKPDKKGIETRSFHDRALAHTWIEKHNGARNLYFHVNTTTRDLEKKAEREQIESLDWLHIDIDPRPREAIDEERVRALGLLTDKLPEGIPPPTVVVFSGGGYQGFWKLEQPFPIGGDLEIAEDAKRWNQQLELVFGGDNCHNIDRIMRLPGTINLPDQRKIEKGRVPELAELISFREDLVYPIADFAQAAAVQTGNDGGFTPTATVEVSGNIERLGSIEELSQWGVSERVMGLCVQGNLRDLEGAKAGDDSRSAWLHDCLCQLARAHVPDEVMYSIITDPDFLISESVLDKGTMMDKYAKRQIGRAKEHASDPRLAGLNERFAVIETIGGKCRVVEEIQDMTLNRSTLALQSFGDFRNRFCNVDVPVGTDRHGNTRFQPQGDWWLKHENRRQFHHIVFDPSRDEIPDVYNLWKGFAYAAQPGNPAPFLDHLRDNICSGNQEHYDYLLGWMAVAVQHPARPGQVAVVLRGPKGAGKSFFGKHFGKLFGRHYLQVSNSSHLVGNFNAHLRDCLILFADEAFFAGDKRHESVLKMLITEDQLTIELKGVDIETASNFVHLIMASNEDWVVPATQGERRFFVLDVGEEKREDIEYFSGIDKHMHAGGYGALLHFLKTYDLSEFEVRKVPQTEALQFQKHHTLKPEEDWWYGKLVEGDLMNNSEGWPRQVSKKAIYLLFIDTMKDLRVTKPLSERGFSLFLKRVCSEINSFQTGKQGQARPYFWNLPTLEEARAEWDVLYGGINWPEVQTKEIDSGKDIPF